LLTPNRHFVAFCGESPYLHKSYLDWRFETLNLADLGLGPDHGKPIESING
jgi:hypothetical protein